jgi:hypothetical protein
MIVNIYKISIHLLSMKKRGMELTISTLVVIILALLMLVMGTILAKATFCKAILGVTSMSDLGQQEIQRLFSEQSDSNVAVKEQVNDIPKVTYYGVGFVIKNTDKVSTTPFRYSVDVVDLGDCHITEAEARDYIITTRSATANIAVGDTYSDVIEFKIPKAAPVCSLKYKINVEKDGASYGSSIFIVTIKEVPFFRGIMC